ncbi:MAG: GNAT family N-acetyltransferase [Pseudomonadota bacterium]
MHVKNTLAPQDVARAAAIDEAVLGSNAREGYIRSVAENHGLSVATLDGEIQAFCCLDARYFFEKPFVSLLIVAPEARRLGLGAALLAQACDGRAEVWTSTNRSNAPMRRLLDKAGWRFCGELTGFDAGDPERFYKTG